MDGLQARFGRLAVLTALVGAVGLAGATPALAAPVPASGTAAQHLVPAAYCTSTTGRTNTSVPGARSSTCTPRQVCKTYPYKKYRWSKAVLRTSCYWLYY